MASTTRRTRPATVKAPVPTADEQKAMERAQIQKQMDDAKLAKSIADDRNAGMSGNALREKYGEWLTGPRRCRMLKKHGYGSVVSPSYDRVEAKEKREQAEAEAAKATKPTPRKRSRAKATA
jgi:hypothetical protein